MYYKYDLKNGIIYEWKQFLLPFFVTLVACFSFTSDIRTAENIGQIDRGIMLSDVIIYLFKGEQPFDPMNPESFRFPFLWLIIQLGLAFITGKYPLSEIYTNHGANVLIKGRSRTKWILSKFLWIFTVCIVYYLIIFLTIITYSKILNYNINLNLVETNSLILLAPIKNISITNLICIYLLPVTTSITISFLQFTIAVLFNSVISFAFTLVMCGVSIFYENIYLIGNCSLLIRNEIYNIDGISIKISYFILLVVIVISFTFSIVYFKNCDILQNRRNE